MLIELRERARRERKEREREGGREREKYHYERNIEQLPPIHALTGNGTQNLGMCPDWRLNL